MSAVTTAPPAAPAALPHGLLAALAAANFAVGLGAFVVVGLLSPVERAFGVTTAQAGFMMSSYALVYALSSPVLVALTGDQPRKRILLGGLALLAAGAVLASIASGFGVLLLARAVMAVGGGLVTPVATAIAVASAAPQLRGRALSWVFSGLSLAQAIGVPAGAWVAYQVGWREAFAAVVGLALVAAAAVRARVPADVAVQPSSLGTLGAVLKDGVLMLAVSFSALAMGAAFVLYTFIVPFLEQTYGLGRDGVTAVLGVYGVGAIAGTSLGGWLTDRIGAVRTLALLAVVLAVVMPIMTVLHPPLALATALVGVWALFGWSMPVAQQARLAALDGVRAPVLFALHAAFIYVGTSLGATVGGWTLSHGGPTGLGPAGAAIALVGLASLGAVGWLRGRAATART